MRLIDADAIKLEKGFFENIDNVPKFFEWLGKQPIINAVPVVRCKDCIWYEIYQLKKDGTDDRRYKPSYCASLGYQTRPDWFCGDGERREDADKE